MIRDASGAPIHTGRNYKRWVEQFGVSSALPAWIQAGSGTVSFFTTASSDGRSVVTSAATLNAEARLETAVRFDTTFLTEIAVTADGLFFNVDSSIEPSIRLDNDGGSGAGVALTQNASENTAVIRIYNASGNVFVPTNYQLRGGGVAVARRSVTLRWNQLTGEVFVEESGAVMAYAKPGVAFGGVTAIQPTRGLIRPRVQAIAMSAAAVAVTAATFAVETWSD